MTERLIQYFGFVILILNLAACTFSTGSIETKPELFTVCSEDKIEIELPAMYKTSGKYCSAVIFVKDITKAEEMVAVALAPTDAENRDEELANYAIRAVEPKAQTEIETMLQRLKHLNIICSQSKNMAELKNSNEAFESDEPENDDKRQINNIIALELKNSMDTQWLSKRHEMTLFSSILSCQVIELNNVGATVIDSFVVEGLSKRYKTYDLHLNVFTKELIREPRGGAQGDFDSEQAYAQATSRASIQLVNRLGNAFPVVGKITGWAGDNLEIEKGEIDGVFDHQVFVLYTKYDGRDRAFALAEVTRLGKRKSLSETTELKVIKWSSSGFVQPIIKAIKGNTSFVQLRDFYAASMGLPPSFFKTEKSGK